MGRRLCIFGFCRSVEMLSDVVEDIVLEQGGEVCYKSIAPFCSNDSFGGLGRICLSFIFPFSDDVYRL